MSLASRLHGTDQPGTDQHRHAHGPDHDHSQARGHAHTHTHAHGDAETEGITLHHGSRYESFTNAFFLGRRAAVFDRLAELSGARPGDRVLDVGCGTGYLTRRLARIVLPPPDPSAQAAPRPDQGSVTGVDASAGMLAQARHLSPPSIAYVVGAAEALDFADESFDLVTSSLMIHHLPRELRGQALREMHRVLRPGGRLLIGEFRPPRSRIARHLVGSLTSPMMLEDQRETLPALIGEAGFEAPRIGALRPWISYFQTART